MLIERLSPHVEKNVPRAALALLQWYRQSRVNMGQTGNEPIESIIFCNKPVFVSQVIPALFRMQKEQPQRAFKRKLLIRIVIRAEA
jgi:hypothetical protein